MEDCAENEERERLDARKRPRRVGPRVFRHEEPKYRCPERQGEPHRHRARLAPGDGLDRQRVPREDESRRERGEELARQAEDDDRHERGHGRVGEPCEGGARGAEVDGRDGRKLEARRLAGYGIGDERLRVDDESERRGAARREHRALQ